MGVKWGRVVRSSGREKERTGEKVKLLWRTVRMEKLKRKPGYLWTEICLSHIDDVMIGNFVVLRNNLGRNLFKQQQTIETGDLSNSRIRQKSPNLHVMLRREKSITSGLIILHTNIFFSIVQQTIVGQVFLIIEASRYYSETLQSVRLPWKSDKHDTPTSTWQHTTITRDRQPCARRDSKPQSLQASSHRPTP